MMQSVIFLGAGASEPFGIPTMTQMIEEFEAALEKNPKPYNTLFSKIKQKLYGNYKFFDIEALITVLTDIIDIDEAQFRILNQPSVHYFSRWIHNYSEMLELNRADALSDRENAKELLEDLKTYVARSCTIKEEPFDIYEGFTRIVLRCSGANYERYAKTKEWPSDTCQIFTTNYDQVIEAFCDRNGFPLANGEEQNEKLLLDRRNNRLYSPQGLVQIYKLHGSTNWYIDQWNRMRHSTMPISVGTKTPRGSEVVKELLIYPAQTKYTFREPFYSMFHQLKESLLQCKKCFIVGYSFRDDDILGLFHDSLDLNKDLRLTLIDRLSPRIIEEKFANYSKRFENLPSLSFNKLAVENLKRHFFE